MCRDLARVVRDVMILSVDPDRAGDGELAEGEVERLTSLSARFSREDVLRAFDVLARAETDMKGAAHPRYHFEMVLLRWMHLRKMIPLATLIEQLGGAAAPAAGPPRPVPAVPKATPAPVASRSFFTNAAVISMTAMFSSYVKKRWPSFRPAPPKA